MEMLLLWLLIAGLTALLAHNKKRSAVKWFALGFLFGIIALIVLLFLKPIENENI